jgi:DNA-binding NarL/FixJ family response regulator
MDASALRNSRSSVVGNGFLKRRILIADDHEVVRKGLTSLLSPNWDVCGQARNGQEALNLVEQLKPELVLLDLSMPIMGGAQTARAIRNRLPNIKIIVFTMHDSDAVREPCKVIGVDLFLTKTCSAGDLRAAIVKVLGEKSYGSGSKGYVSRLTFCRHPQSQPEVAQPNRSS